MFITDLTIDIILNSNVHSIQSLISKIKHYIMILHITLFEFLYEYLRYFTISKFYQHIPFIALPRFLMPFASSKRFYKMEIPFVQ